MERPKIRIGKDFTVLWNIYKRENGVKTPYMLAAGKENYVLRLLEKPCARDPRSPVPLTLAVQNSLTL